MKGPRDSSLIRPSLSRLNSSSLNSKSPSLRSPIRVGSQVLKGSSIKTTTSENDQVCKRPGIKPIRYNYKEYQV